MSGAILALAVALSQAPAAAALPPKQSRAVDRACDAYANGSPLGLLDSLAPVLSAASEAQLAEIETRLKGRALPPLADLLHQARMLMAQQGLSRELPAPGTREAMLVIPELKQDIDEVLIAAEDHPVMENPLVVPVSMEDFQAVFWKIHVLGNQLETCRRLAEYLVSFGGSVPRGQYEKLDQTTRELLESDYAKDALAMQAEYVRELKEREIELRVRRIALAANILESEGLSKEHVLAASVWKVDQQLATEYLQKRPRNQPGRLSHVSQLIRQIAVDAKKAERAAGPLTDKAEALVQALHWWTRARYGDGPEQWGLAKSVAAMQTADGQFALFMPTEPPKAIDPFDARIMQASNSTQRYGAAPKYDRRHLYWWAWENRSVSEEVVSVATVKPFW